MKVLLATDGSKTAAHSASFLAGMDLAPKLDVTLLTVSHDPADFANAYVPVADEWKEQELERVEKHQDEVGAILQGKVNSVSKRHHWGNAASQILSVADHLDADLIVMGAVGHSMIRRMFLGSTSDYVANHAKCSVLIVRPGKEGEKDQLERVTVAYDGSRASEHAVEELVGLPWNAMPKVSVLSIVQEYDVLLGDGISAVALTNQEEWFERMRGENENMTERVAKTMPAAEAHVTQCYHVGDGIVDFVEKNDQQLLVVGDAGHGVLEDLLLGSTSKFVMRHAPCSVWISRRHRHVEDES